MPPVNSDLQPHTLPHYPLNWLTKEELRTLKSMSRKKAATPLVLLARQAVNREPISRELAEIVILNIVAIDPTYGMRTRASVILCCASVKDAELADLAAQQIAKMLVYTGNKLKPTNFVQSIQGLFSRLFVSKPSALPLLRRYRSHSALFRTCVLTLKRLQSGYGAGAMAEVLMLPSELYTKKMAKHAASGINRLLINATKLKVGELPTQHIESIAKILVAPNIMGRICVDALRTLHVHGGLESIDKVNQLEGTKLNAEVRATLNEVLPAIRARAEHQYNAANLLRPSRADESKTLLRPASGTGIHDSSKLLRPASDAETAGDLLTSVQPETSEEHENR